MFLTNSAADPPHDLRHRLGYADLVVHNYMVCREDSREGGKMKPQRELWEIFWATCSVFAVISAFKDSTPFTLLFCYFGMSFLCIRKWFGPRWINDIDTQSEKEKKDD